MVSTSLPWYLSPSSPRFRPFKISSAFSRALRHHACYALDRVAVAGVHDPHLVREGGRRCRMQAFSQTFGGRGKFGPLLTHGTMAFNAQTFRDRAELVFANRQASRKRESKPRSVFDAGSPTLLESGMIAHPSDMR